MKNGKIVVCFVTVVISLFAASLHAKDTMLFVYYSDYAPFGWIEDGKMQGLYIDIVNEAFTNRSGIPIEHEGYPWKRAQNMVRKGKADGYCTVVTPERLTFSYASEESIIEVNFKIYAPVGSPRLNLLREVKSIPELKSFKLVDYRGSGWAEKNLSGLDMHWLNTNIQVWKYLMKGRADATVKNEWTTRHVLKKLGYQDKIVELPNNINEKPITFNIFIGKKSPFAKYREQVNDKIRQMKQDGTLERIYDKYR